MARGHPGGGGRRYPASINCNAWNTCEHQGMTYIASKLSLQISVSNFSIFSHFPYFVSSFHENLKCPCLNSDSIHTCQHDRALCKVYGSLFHRNNEKTSHKLPENDAGNPVKFMVNPYTRINRKNTDKSIYLEALDLQVLTHHLLQHWSHSQMACILNSISHTRELHSSTHH